MVLFNFYASLFFLSQKMSKTIINLSRPSFNMHNLKSWVLPSHNDNY